MLYELPDLGFIKIQGNDAKKFLQGQLTCDLESITPQHSSLGAHCNPQGRVISLFYIFQFQENYYLLMQKSMVSIALSNLKKYAIFFKTEMTDASQEIAALGWQNSNLPSSDTSDTIAIIPVTHNHERYFIVGNTSEIKELQNKLENKLQVKLQVKLQAKLGSKPEAKPQAKLETKLQTISAEQTKTTSASHWHYLNILDGLPCIYPETSGKFLPHEINLDTLNAISFNKGCYTGQEIIARMHYKGKLKTRLYTAYAASSTLAPPPGSDIYTLESSKFKACATLVDACQEVYNNKYPVLIIAREAPSNDKPLYLAQDISTELTVAF